MSERDDWKLIELHVKWQPGSVHEPPPRYSIGISEECHKSHLRYMCKARACGFRLIDEETGHPAEPTTKVLDMLDDLKETIGWELMKGLRRQADEEGGGDRQG